MGALAYRTLQTTSTTGTGTITLNAVASGRRSFADAYGVAAVPIRYVISGTTFYEVGIGSFDGGTPGTLTRTTIIASSNAGSAVSLPAGTADVFPWIEPSDHGVVTGTGALTLTLAQLGNAVVWSGTGAQSAALPAYAGVPEGAGYQIRNAGTALLTIDPNATETINGATTLILAPGASVDVLRIGAGWQGFFAADANAAGYSAWGGTAGGTANALTATLTPAPAAYIVGQTVRLLIGSTNTAAATLNLNSLGTKNIKRWDGATDIVVGDLPAGALAEMTYDGTSFRLRPVLAGRFIGEEIAFFGSTLPTGVLWCAGQAVSRTTYAALFAVISTTYGVGDGSTTFNLPDMRGRFGLGQDDMNGSAANRVTTAGSGMDGATLGAAGGDQLTQALAYTATQAAHDHRVYYAEVGGASTLLAATASASNAGNYVTISSATPAITITPPSGGTYQNIPPALVRNVGIYAGV